MFTVDARSGNAKYRRVVVDPNQLVEATGLTWAQRASMGDRGVLDVADIDGAKNRIIDRTHKAAIRRAIGNVRGQRILDYGCGNGRIAKWLVDRGALVTGVDPSPEMIAAARLRVPTATFGDLGTVLADFDAAITVYALQALGQDMTGAIERIADALNPGGRLVSVEHVDQDLPLTLYREAMQAAGLTVTATWTVRVAPSRVMRHRLPMMPTLMRWEAKLSSARSQYVDAAFVAVKRASA